MPLVKVTFVSSLSPAFGGADSVEVDARTLRELMRKLAGKYPRLQKQIDQGIALAVDGHIYRDDWDVDIPTGSEVYLMPRIQGG